MTFRGVQRWGASERSERELVAASHTVTVAFPGGKSSGSFSSTVWSTVSFLKVRRLTSARTVSPGLHSLRSRRTDSIPADVSLSCTSKSAETRSMVALPNGLLVSRPMGL